MGEGGRTRRNQTGRQEGKASELDGLNDSWWSNGSAYLTVINYHVPSDQGLIILAARKVWSV